MWIGVILAILFIIWCVHSSGKQGEEIESKQYSWTWIIFCLQVETYLNLCYLYNKYKKLAI